MSGKRIYELAEKSSLENDYFFALDKSGTANAQKVNVSKILGPISNISGSSDEYSASKAYTKGELVIHDNKLYECNTSCSAASWATNQGYFTQTTLAAELTDVKSSLNWKAVGATTGSTVLKIPTSNWKELNIQARVFGTPLCCCSVYTCNNVHAERDYMVYSYLSQNIINAAHLTGVSPQEWWARIYVNDDNIQISEASVGVANIYIEAYFR